MAERPIFMPCIGRPGVATRVLEFPWAAGIAPIQKKKNVSSLHRAAESIGISPILEVSSKSELPLGVALSAFNLRMTTRKGMEISVEAAFQGSKVFERGGPYRDLYSRDPLSAKRDSRLIDSGNLVSFEFFGRVFPIVPRTLFYDWIYLNALNQRVDLKDSALLFEAFTDIEFNPQRSINCQARSVALFVSLSRCDLAEAALSSVEKFYELLAAYYGSEPSEVQASIF